MFLLRPPSPSTIETFLATQRLQPLSYPEVGATCGEPPAGYNIDHNRVLLGRGEESYVKAVAAIRSWQMFNLGWCRVYPTNAPVEAGMTVAINISHFGFWSLNACRIVYLLEGEGALQKYGFAYGTLAEHGEIGEERFSVEWNQDEGSVWYDLYAFSRPGPLLAKVGYPLSRLLQRRFARASKMAIMRAVKNGRT
jgi:uncharacterized protein (UPF0548 family)